MVATQTLKYWSCAPVERIKRPVSASTVASTAYFRMNGFLHDFGECSHAFHVRSCCRKCQGKMICWKRLNETAPGVFIRLSPHSIPQLHSWNAHAFFKQSIHSEIQGRNDSGCETQLFYALNGNPLYSVLTCE